MNSKHTHHDVKHRNNSGQAIILVAVMMVALMGILGLAIDGGGLYFLHRDTQNAVDSALLAALYQKCSSGWPIKPSLNIPDYNNHLAGYNQDMTTFANVIRQAARTAASENGYNDDPNDLIDTSGVTLLVDPQYVPPSLGASTADQTNYIRVQLTAPKPAFFIQLVYPEPLQVTSIGVGYCEPPVTNLIPQGMAIISLRPEGNAASCTAGAPSFRIGGGGTVRVRNSGIFINSNHSSCAVKMDGSTSMLDVTGGICAVVGDGVEGEGTPRVLCPGGAIHPDPMVNTHPLSYLDPPDDACTTSTGSTVHVNGVGTTQTISPGHYKLIKITNGHLTLDPGLYCIEEIDASGGRITGEGVTIYMPPAPDNKGIKISGAEFDLSAPDSSTLNCPTDGAVCDWPGLLIWSDITDAQADVQSEINGTRIEISGHGMVGSPSGDKFTGTIYAPRSQCHIVGQSEGWAINTQMICWNVNLEGGALLDISYDPPEFLLTAPVVQLTE